MSSLFAFLHHLAAFALVAAMVLEFVLIRDELNARTARRLALADAVLGVSAAVLLVVGLLRVFYFEKGAAYYPTLKFLSWRKKAPEAASVPAIRRLLHLELVGVVLILLFAALMARGSGTFG